MMFFPERFTSSIAVLLIAWKIPTTTDAFTVTPSPATSRTSLLKSSDFVSSTSFFVSTSSSDDSQFQEDIPASNSSEPSTAGENTNTEVSVPEDEVKLPVASTVSGMDILNSPEFLNRKRDVLLNDLQTIQNDILLAKERLQQNKDEWGTQISDLSKEYEMIQQRMNVQSNSNNDVATSQVVRSMLSVLDNFDRAFGQVTAQTEAEIAIENEYKQVYRDILDLFKKLGVQEVPTVGTEFDYEIHQAVMQKPSAEYEEGIVCEELQKGFRINDTLIRAAMVAVAM